jgi:hypothetical protein
MAALHADSTVSMQDKFHRMLKLQSRLGDYELIKSGEWELIKVDKWQHSMLTPQ